MDKNLIICTSILQILIAERIIDIVPGDYTVIVITRFNNDKFKYYANRIRKKTVLSLYYHLKAKTKLSRLLEVLKFQIDFSHFPREGYKYCFIASIDSAIAHKILSNLQIEEFRTFDDGTANIIDNSKYYKNSNVSLIKNIIFQTFGIKWKKEDVRIASKMHYTLYPNYDNIVKPVQAINLFNYENARIHKQENSKDEKISILIGQPILKRNTAINTDFIVEVLKRHSINFYYPHPREKDTIPNVTYITSELIIEDYIVSLINENPHITINLYTFFSSAALNIQNISQVKIFVLFNEILYKDYKSIYDVFKQNNKFVFLEA